MRQSLSGMNQPAMEMSCDCCLCCCALESAKEKGKQKKHNGRSCSQERQILMTFVETFNIPQSLLPNGGTMCYNCLMKLKKWAKMTAEIAVIQEELTTYLQRSQSSRVRRDKRILCLKEKMCQRNGRKLNTTSETK